MGGRGREQPVSAMTQFGRWEKGRGKEEKKRGEGKGMGGVIENPHPQFLPKRSIMSLDASVYGVFWRELLLEPEPFVGR